MVELSDLVELEVVHRALMAARFAESPSDPVLLGSPYLAIIHSSIVDEIVAAYREKGQAGITARWEQWREISKDCRKWMIVRDQLSSPEMGWRRLSQGYFKVADGGIVAGQAGTFSRFSGALKVS